MEKLDVTKNYNRENFESFLYDFLPEDFEQETNQIFSDFKNIEDAFMLGTCKSLDLDVYEFKIKRNCDARVTLTNEAVSCMKKYGNPNCLAVFYSDESNDWRFSLITTEYSIENGRIKTKHSNPKRFSFLLGKNCKRHTPETMLSKSVGTIEELKDCFNVEVVTKEFFTLLFNWYSDWACKVCKFPSDKCIAAKADLTTEKNEINLIRLITRIMFVWFIKQKNLIPSWIFNKEELADILTDADLTSDKKGNYYNAVLQNLFFGALNKKIEERKFADVSTAGIANEQYGIKTYFRDANEGTFFKFAPKDMVEKFHDVPFLNGGLFECLDYDVPHGKDSHKVHYVDGFSREKSRRAFVPNILFWNEDEKQPGLFTILSRYNFTVEESTPNDVQVALDPELLGKIFENLLGTYNPETRESARKESGSFYTPREIVSYMVNSSIKAYLQEKVPEVNEENIEKLTNDDKADDSQIKVTEEQINKIRKSLFQIKIIDPACGSGAFPMGILNKLVEIHVLLDKLSARTKSEHNLYIKKGQSVNYNPDESLKIYAEYLGNQEFKLSVNGNTEDKIYNSQDLALHVKEIINKYNKELGKKTIANLFSQGRIDDGKSFNSIKTKTDIHQIVDEETNDIIWQYRSYNVQNKFRQYRNKEQNVSSFDFTDEDNDFEYAKYLYSLKTRIIQDSIFGVDIQPIAVQISKLRFFISLICEQPKLENHPEENYGYNPLPNLETKFVAANTLIGLDKDEKEYLNYSDENITKLKNDLINIRKEHFTAKTAAEKKANREADKKLRLGIINYLKKNSTEINLVRINDLKEQEQLLKTQIDNLPVCMIEKNKGREDLFGNTDNEQYDKNETARKQAQNDLKKLEKELSAEINKSNKTKTIENLEKLIDWNPYNQSADASNYFDPEWMFGVKDGFDIVIGNPPYVSAPMQIASPQLAKQRQELIDSKRYKSLYQKWDLYIPFIEIGTQLNCENGITSMIVPFPLTNQLYAKVLRKMLVEENDMFELVDLNGTKIFDNATVSNCIPFVKKSKTQEKTWISKIDEKLNISRMFEQSKNDLVQDEKNYVWNVTQEKREINRHSDMHVLGDYCYISVGMVLNSDEKERIEVFKKADLISNTQDKVHCRKFLESKDCGKYAANKIRYLEYDTKRIPDKCRRPTFRELYLTPKLMFNRLGELQVFYDSDGDFTTSDAMFVCLKWDSLSKVENKSISSSIKKFSTMSRSEMETLSKTVDLRYLLGVMNSKYASVLLTNLRGGDYHIYPEHIRNIPIPSATSEQQQPIIDLVDKILAAKKADPAADTSAEEHKIDLLVYHLYGLSFEEAKIIDKGLTEEEFNKES